MKLSLAPISLHHYFDTDKEKRTILELVRECGFTCIDYDVKKEYLEGDFEAHAMALRKNMEELGMYAGQAHAPILDPFDPQSNHLEYFRKSLVFCQIAGIPHIVIHAGAVKGNTREEFFENNTAFYRSLIPFAEKTGVGILIENIGHYEDPYFLWNGKDLRELIDCVDHPLFNACWDVGHANLFWKKDCDQYSSVTALGEKLLALHVHDNCGYFEKTYRHHRIDMHAMPFSSFYASVNYDALIQGLIDIGYKGTFNFETNVPVKPVRPSFEYNGEIVRKLEKLPISLWKQTNVLLYEIGKYMLESYGIFEE